MSHYANSEAIFSVIGDDVVVDQYDILYSNLQAGSTYDNYMTGSLIRNFFADTHTFINGERSLAFSKLEVSSLARPNIQNFVAGDKNLAYNLQPWRERAGIIRSLKLFSSDERFYDSLAPNLVDMLKALNGKIVSWDLRAFSLGQHNLLVLDNDPHNPFEENTGFSPVGFESTFPFEPIFSKIKRNKRLADSFVSTEDIAGNSTSPLKLRRLMIAELNSGSHFFSNYSFDANYWVDTINFAALIGGEEPFFRFGEGTLETETSKILFGFGDRRSIKYELSDPPDGALTSNPPGFYTIGKNYLVERRYSNSFWSSLIPNGFTISAGPIIRGWKYGLMDGNPHYTSCVFRRDRYGQFRDMLEQRLNTTFVHDANNNPLRYLGNVETPALPFVETSKSQLSVGGFSLSNAAASLPSIDSLINDSPVRVSFVRQSYIESTKDLLYFSEKPENTWSSNLSSYATSSLPYFDNVSRNRNQVPTLAGSIVLSSLSDLFGNTTIGR